MLRFVILFHLLKDKNSYEGQGDPNKEAETVLFKPCGNDKVNGRNESENLCEDVCLLSFAIEKIPVIKCVLIKRSVVAHQRNSDIIESNAEPKGNRIRTGFHIEKTEITADKHTIGKKTVHHAGKIVNEESDCLSLCKVVLNVTAQLRCLKITGVGDGNAENSAEKMLPEAFKNRADNGDILCNYINYCHDISPDPFMNIYSKVMSPLMHFLSESLNSILFCLNIASTSSYVFVSSQMKQIRAEL